jgi:serine/threonine protein kinase/tetratricopeptide (TPR) repeat protein
MGRGTTNPAWTSLDEFVEAFETSQAEASAPPLEEFLPDVDHPLRFTVLRELVRVELEYSWQRGRPQRLEHYQERFPELFRHGPTLSEITFEEYRLRQQAGEAATPAEYQQRFGINPADWPVARESANKSVVRAARHYHELQANHGDDGALDDWFDRLAGRDAPAQLFQEMHRTDPGSADGFAAALTSLPEVGGDWHGFHLLEELGRGAFGRVFLARQGDLAGRLVALKISALRYDESQTLAQLQHTHIVPLYSLHRAGALQAVVMPYLGSTTLADVVDAFKRHPSRPLAGKELVSTLAVCKRSTTRSGSSAPLPLPGTTSLPPRESDSPLAQLERSSYVHAVLRIGAQLADGLAHAHEHGIVHRDLKPANVLLTDDGRPMLLDFNLAEDTKLNGLAAAVIGGTLPYMAPEHLDAFDRGRGGVDGRSDIYALGVILYELLAGRLPHRTLTGPVADVVAQVRADRQRPPPPLAGFNRNVTPAVAAIVHRCLEPSPDRRYPTARALQEDLERHLRDEPLRFAREPLWERLGKWRRRHPLQAAGLVLALILAALWPHFERERLEKSELRGANTVLQATVTRSRFLDEMKQVQVLFLNSLSGDAGQREQAGQRCAEVLGRYKVLDNRSWAAQPLVRALPAAERQQLRDDVVELLLLWARVTHDGAAPQRVDTAIKLNRLAELECEGGELAPAVERQRKRFLGELVPAPELKSMASPRARALHASEAIFDRRFAEATTLLEDAARQSPDQFTIWLDLGICYDQQARYSDAAACYGTCIALAPKLPPLYLLRGIAQLRLERFAAAEADFSRAIDLNGEFADAYLHRALARAELRRFPPAIDDATRALARGSPPVRTCLVRARLFEMNGAPAQAQSDRDEALRQQPLGEACYLARGFVRLAADPRGSLLDFDAALRCQPRSLPALQTKAHIWADLLQEPRQALTILDELVKQYPAHAPAWSGRGIVRARLNDLEGARRDAHQARTCGRQPAILYQVAGIYALTSRQQPEDQRIALRLLDEALWQGFGLATLERDHDLDPLRDLPEFQRIVAEARTRSSSPQK